VPPVGSGSLPSTSTTPRNEIRHRSGPGAENAENIGQVDRIDRGGKAALPARRRDRGPQHPGGDEMASVPAMRTSRRASAGAAGSGRRPRAAPQRARRASRRARRPGSTDEDRDAVLDEEPAQPASWASSIPVRRAGQRRTMAGGIGDSGRWQGERARAYVSDVERVNRYTRARGRMSRTALDTARWAVVASPSRAAPRRPDERYVTE